MNVSKAAWLCLFALAACTENGVVDALRKPLEEGPRILGHSTTGPVILGEGAGPSLLPGRSDGPTFTAGASSDVFRHPAAPPVNYSAATSGGRTTYVLWQSAAGWEYALPVSGFITHGDIWLVGIFESQWQVAAIADMTGDANDDLILENRTSGTRGIAAMNGIKYTPTWFEIGTIAPRWRIAAVIDFTGDGKPDILWQSTDGICGIWEMDGERFTGAWYGLGQVGPEWYIADAADMTSDGRPDVIWENVVTGGRGVWPMNGPQPTGAWLDIGTIQLDWRIVAVADFNGDLKPDLLWWNNVHGGTNVWAMDGVRYTGNSATFGSGPAGPTTTYFQIAGVFGFNACGASTPISLNQTVSSGLGLGNCQQFGFATARYTLTLAKQTAFRITLDSALMQFRVRLQRNDEPVLERNQSGAGQTMTVQAILPPGDYLLEVSPAVAGDSGPYSLSTSAIAADVALCTPAVVYPFVSTTQKIEATDCTDPLNAAARYDKYVQHMIAGQSYTIEAGRTGGELTIEVWRAGALQHTATSVNGALSTEYVATTSAEYEIRVSALPGAAAVPYFVHFE